jgi:hypothetical protein
MAQNCGPILTKFWLNNGKIVAKWRKIVVNWRENCRPILPIILFTPVSVLTILPID